MSEMHYPETPLLSCIVTSFQKIPYLYEAIDSVLIQDYPQLELIVADDGSDGFSTDAMTTYIQKHKGPNIKDSVVFTQKENVGTVQNILSALKHATGLYCVNLDGDDVFDHDSVLSEMMDYALSKHLDLLECGKRRCDSNLNEIELLPTPIERARLQKLNTAKKQYHSFAVLRFLNIGGGSGMLYRRDSVAENGLFDCDYRNWQDGPSLLAYVQRGKMIPVNHEIIAIKYRGGGVSNSPRNNASAFVHIGEDRRNYISKVTLPDRWNPYVLRRRRFLFYYYWESARSKKRRLMLLVRFPIMGFRMLRGSIKKHIFHG